MTYFDCGNHLKTFVSPSKDALADFLRVFSLRLSRSLLNP